MTTTTAPQTIEDRHAEAGLTLDDYQPRALSFWDQGALWANLGISLLGLTGAIFVLAPGMSVLAALTAVVVGTVIGTLPVALAAVAGARSGRPAMVLLRGLFGAKLSYLPTALNLVQLLGWATFELVVIGAAATQLTHTSMAWPYIVAGGVLTTMMAIFPLGSVRLLRRVVLIAVLAALAYFTWRLIREPAPHALPSFTRGSWTNFWAGADTVVAVAVSWVPLAADYTRHSRTERAAFGGAMIGYSVTQIVCYALGVLAFSTVVSQADSPSVQQDHLFAAFIAISWLGFGALVVRELDESFANVYSTAISVQNILPRLDRRWLATGIGAAATALALTFNIGAYQDFLLLIGSVFVPMFAVFAVCYFVRRQDRTWDTSDHAPSRWSLLVPWLLGFAAYQLVNPGSLGWWTAFWGDVRTWLHLSPPSWISASVTSFLVAALATWVLTAFARSRPTAPAPEPIPPVGASQ